MRSWDAQVDRAALEWQRRQPETTEKSKVSIYDCAAPAFGHCFGASESLLCVNAGCSADWFSHQFEPTACVNPRLPRSAERAARETAAEEIWTPHRRNAGQAGGMG